MNTCKRVRQLLLIVALGIPAFNCFAQQVSLPTQSLESREKVTINVVTPAPFALGRESVTMSNNVITVVMRSIDDAISPGPSPPGLYTPANSGDVILGRLPQGSYTVSVIFRNLRTSTDTPVGSLQFAVKDDVVARSAAYPAYNYTDLWWNPLESGWGISIHVNNDKLFAAWFVYDASGKPTWYTLQQGRWETSTLYSGFVYATQSNPNAGLGPLTTPVLPTPVGRGSLTFNGTDQADFSYVVNSVESRKSIVRQVF